MMQAKLKVCVLSYKYEKYVYYDIKKIILMHFFLSLMHAKENWKTMESLVL